MLTLVYVGIYQSFLVDLSNFCVYSDLKLTLEGEMALLPPELVMDMNKAAEYEAQLQAANAVPVPVDDDF